MTTPSRGFTLIELLVVVAIIGILSSVILSSVREARLKAADADVRQSAIQLRNLLEQERTNSGTYAALKQGGAWKAAGAGCLAAAFGTSQFSTRAAEVCTHLVAASSVGSSATVGCKTTCVFFQTVAPTNSNEKYSIMAYLPYESEKAQAQGLTPSVRYLCVGSSGNQSIADGAAWTEDGCQANP